MCSAQGKKKKKTVIILLIYCETLSLLSVYISFYTKQIDKIQTVTNTVRIILSRNICTHLRKKDLMFVENLTFVWREVA